MELTKLNFNSKLTFIKTRYDLDFMRSENFTEETASERGYFTKYNP